MASLGDRIKELRKKYGYTQSEFINILKEKYNLKADRVCCLNGSVRSKALILKP